MTLYKARTLKLNLWLCGQRVLKVHRPHFQWNGTIPSPLCEVNFKFVYKASPPLPIIQDILSSAITSAICSSLQQGQSETSSKLLYFFWETTCLDEKENCTHEKSGEDAGQAKSLFRSLELSLPLLQASQALQQQVPPDIMWVICCTFTDPSVSFPMQPVYVHWHIWKLKPYKHFKIKILWGPGCSWDSLPDDFGTG